MGSKFDALSPKQVKEALAALKNPPPLTFSDEDISTLNEIIKGMRWVGQDDITYVAAQPSLVRKLFTPLLRFCERLHERVSGARLHS